MATPIPPAPAPPPPVAMAPVGEAVESRPNQASKRRNAIIALLLLLTYIGFSALRNNMWNPIYNTVGGLIEALGAFAFGLIATDQNGVMLAISAGGLVILIALIGGIVGAFIYSRLNSD